MHSAHRLPLGRLTFVCLAASTHRGSATGTEMVRRPRQAVSCALSAPAMGKPRAPARSNHRCSACGWDGCGIHQARLLAPSLTLQGTDQAHRRYQSLRILDVEDDRMLLHPRDRACHSYRHVYCHIFWQSYCHVFLYIHRHVFCRVSATYSATHIVTCTLPRGLWAAQTIFCIV